MRRHTALIASASAVLIGGAAMAVIANSAADVPPSLLAPAPATAGVALVIERVAFVLLLLGLPSMGIAVSSIVAPASLLLPMRVLCFSFGLFLSCLLVLGIAWGTASSAEVMSIDTSIADGLAAVSGFLLMTALMVGCGAIAAMLHRIVRNPARSAHRS